MAGTLHRREKLAGIFWPDTSEQKVRTYLRNELWRIRKALPEAVDIEYFLTDNLTIGFDPAFSYWLDLNDLRNLGNTPTAEGLMQALSNGQASIQNPYRAHN